MLKSVKVTNHIDETLEMILANPKTSEFVIESIDGIGPEKTNINSTENQIYDGASFDSSVTGIKNIVLHLKFLPNDYDVERVRHKSYQYFQNKKFVRLEFSTDKKNTYIEGYVESNEPSIFDEMEGCDVSVLCMDPYFKYIDDYNRYLVGIEGAFQFPFSNDGTTIVNGSAAKLKMGDIWNSKSRILLYPGNVEVGLKIKVTLSGNINSLYIYNRTLNQQMLINVNTVKSRYNIPYLLDGDYILIDTTRGEKHLELYHNGQTYSADAGLNIQSSDWLFFDNGNNQIEWSSSHDENVSEFIVNNEVLYGGV